MNEVLVWKFGGMMLIGENWNTWRKTVPFPTTHMAWTGFGWIWACAVWGWWLTTLATAWHKSKIEYSKSVSVLRCQDYCILLEKGHEVLALKQCNAWAAGPHVHPFIYCSLWPLEVKLDLVVWWEYMCTWVIYIYIYIYIITELG
jgi:hypothetical protein